MTDAPKKVEVIISVQRRRRWNAAEKMRMVEESLEPGASVGLVARPHGVNRLPQPIAWPSDNGRCYVARDTRTFARDIGLLPKTTPLDRPQSNGMAEAFVRTSLREWAYAMPFHSSAERARAMPPWLCHYNSLRPHSARGGKPPIPRLARDNLLGNDSWSNIRPD